MSYDLIPAFPILPLLFYICSHEMLSLMMESRDMAARKMATQEAPGRENQVSDDEVDEAIALFGGDSREAVRALVGALHHLVSRGYARGRVRVVTPSAPDAGAEEACVH